ncbi:MAG: hypothetical protein OEZ36_09045 [Spirochaetota bacterium]|nr:hypothetical protein [Spirochaetota bacterium]
MNHKWLLVIFALLMALNIFNCSNKYTNYDSFMSLEPLEDDAKVRYFMDEPEFKYTTIGKFYIFGGKEEWQVRIAKKYARRQGADIVFLARMVTTFINGSKIGSTRTFIFARKRG